MPFAWFSPVCLPFSCFQRCVVPVNPIGVTLLCPMKHVAPPFRTMLLSELLCLFIVVTPRHDLWEGCPGPQRVPHEGGTCQMSPMSHHNIGGGSLEYPCCRSVEVGCVNILGRGVGGGEVSQKCSTVDTLMNDAGGL